MKILSTKFWAGKFARFYFGSLKGSACDLLEARMSASDRTSTLHSRSCSSPFWYPTLIEDDAEDGDQQAGEADAVEARQGGRTFADVVGLLADRKDHQGWACKHQGKAKPADKRRPSS